MYCDKSGSDREGCAEDQLKAPFEYIRKMPGKHIRSKLAEAFNQWLRIDESVLEKIVSVVEMLHNASLMIDDIEDSSTLRRGIPAAHSVYGIPRTINTANFIYFFALSECSKLEKAAAVKVFTEEMLELHRGQGKDLYWRDTVQCPTEEDYQQMVLQKTGGLFALAVHLMELYSNRKYDFTPLIQNLALYFQIRDDYLNLCSPKYADQKGFAEDLTEGKFSLPIVFALRNGNTGVRDDDEVLNILRQKPTDIDVKKYCIRVMRQRGSFRKTLDKLKIYYNGIMEQIEKLHGNDMLSNIVKNLNQAIEESELLEEQMN